MYQIQTLPASHPVPPGITYESSDSVDILFNAPQLLVSYVQLDEEQGEWCMTRLCMFWNSVAAISADPSTLSGSMKVMLLSPATLNGRPDQPWSLDALAEIWQDECTAAQEPIPAMRYVLSNGQTITFAFDAEANRQWRCVAQFRDGVLMGEGA